MDSQRRGVNVTHQAAQTSTRDLSGRGRDPKGAAFYIIAVLLVYSISIVALIMSRIKRKHVKLLEDREIHKYLREFQVVKEKSTRDSYHDMKKAIMARLTTNHGKPGTPFFHATSSGASLATMTSSAAAMGRPVFPLLPMQSEAVHTSYNVHGRNSLWNVTEHRLSAPGTSSFITKTTKHISLRPNSLSPVFELTDPNGDSDFNFGMRNTLLESDSDNSSWSEEEEDVKALNEDATFELTTRKIPTSKKALLKKNDGKERLEKSKQSTTKQSIKHETLFEQGQKINWVEMNESKTTFEKRFSTKNSLLDNKVFGIANNIGSDAKKGNKIPIAYPFLPSSQKTSKATSLSDYESTTNDSKENLLSDKKEAIIEMTDNKSKASSPSSLNFFTLENPLKVSDSFESPPIEVRSMNILQQKMGIQTGSGGVPGNDAGGGEKKSAGSAGDCGSGKKNNVEQTNKKVIEQGGLIARKRQMPPLPTKNKSGSFKRRDELARLKVESSKESKHQNTDLKTSTHRLHEPHNTRFRKKIGSECLKDKTQLGSGVRLNTGLLDEVFARKGSIKFADDGEDHRKDKKELRTSHKNRQLTKRSMIFERVDEAPEFIPKASFDSFDSENSLKITGRPPLTRKVSSNEVPGRRPVTRKSLQSSSSKNCTTVSSVFSTEDPLDYADPRFSDAVPVEGQEDYF